MVQTETKYSQEESILDFARKLSFILSGSKAIAQSIEQGKTSLAADWIITFREVYSWESLWYG